MAELWQVDYLELAFLEIEPMQKQTNHYERASLYAQLAMVTELRRIADALSASSQTAVTNVTEPIGINTTVLKDSMVAHFNDNELRDICGRIHVDYDELDGTTKTLRIQELIQRLQRTGRLHELIPLLNEMRTKINWSQKP